MEEPRDTFEDFMRRTSGWGVYMEFALLRKALSEITHIHTLKAFFIFHERRDVVIHKNRRGPARYEVRYETEIKLSYEWAEKRGIPRKYFARAVRELHERGYIDIIYRGSGSLKDCSRYRLSNRWRTGKPLEIPLRRRGRKDDKEIPEKKLERDENGRWTRLPEISQVGKRKLIQVAECPLEDRQQVADHLLENENIAHFSSGRSPTNLKTSHALQDVDDGREGIKKRTRTSDSRSRGTATPIRRDDANTSPKQWRPALSEIRENVAEILRQRPDPRVDDPQFIKLIAGQLSEALAGRLNPSRVHSDFLGKHGFDDWTTDLLFTIATINPVREGVTN